MASPASPRWLPLQVNQVFAPRLLAPPGADASCSSHSESPGFAAHFYAVMTINRTASVLHRRFLALVVAERAQLAEKPV
jgi:hypothetical protein